MLSIKKISYALKSVVKWGSAGVVAFITKEARECGMKLRDPIVVSVIDDKGEKKILIEKAPSGMKKL